MTALRRRAQPRRLEDCAAALEACLGGNGHGEDIRPLLQALRALAQHPESETRQKQLAAEFSRLGAAQGAVLAHAPYLGLILPHELLDSLDY